MTLLIILLIHMEILSPATAGLMATLYVSSRLVYRALFSNNTPSRGIDLFKTSLNRQQYYKKWA